MKVNIVFFRNDPFSQPNGFDMGGVVIESENKKISSQENSSNSMMIYIAIADLIFGVLEMRTKNTIYEFVGADSSFCVNFKAKGNLLEIFQKKGSKIVCKRDELLDSLCLAVDDFLSSGNDLPVSDSVSSDLYLAVERLKRVKSTH